VLVLELPLAGWTMSTDYRASDQKMLETLGLSTLLLSGLLISAFSASGVLAREIEDKTALTVISKPVSRATFVLGKFFGVSAAVACAFYICAIVFLMTIRHRVMSAAPDPWDMPVITLGLLAIGLTILVAMLGNLIFGWHVTSAGVWAGLIFFTVAMLVISFVGKDWTIVPMGYDAVPRTPTDMPVLHSQLLIGILLMLMAVLILCAIAVTVSTRLGQVLTLLACMGAFFLGSMHPLMQNLAQKTPAVSALTWLLPNLTYFYALDALSMEKAIPPSMVGMYGLYCVIYVAAVLAIGIALFQTRQLESQQTSGSLPGMVGMLAWAGRACGLALCLGGLVMFSLLLNKGGDAVAISVRGGSLLVGGIACWLLWGYFSRAAKWSYYAVFVIFAALLGYCLAVLFVPAMAGAAYRLEDVQMGAAAVVSAAILLILVLPRSRMHFKNPK